MSCVVYGMAFDFFNISGSLFVETNTEPKSFVSTRVIHDDDKWFGAVLGSFTSGWAIDKYFTKSFSSAMIWLVFLKQKQRTLRCWSSLKPRSLISADGVLSKEFS
jgi:NHS family xanthosine MFS transporter